jgi:hypothetical protein
MADVAIQRILESIAQTVVTPTVGLDRDELYGCGQRAYNSLCLIVHIPQAIATRVR